MKFQFTVKELLFFTVVIALITWMCVVIPVSMVWPITTRRPTGFEITQRLLLGWPAVVIVCLMVVWAFRRLRQPPKDDDSDEE
jgi:hypothetical protein